MYGFSLICQQVLTQDVLPEQIQGDCYPYFLCRVAVLFSATEARGTTASQSQWNFQDPPWRHESGYRTTLWVAVKHLGTPLWLTGEPRSVFPRVPDEEMQTSPGARPDTSPWKLTHISES